MQAARGALRSQAAGARAARALAAWCVNTVSSSGNGASREWCLLGGPPPAQCARGTPGPAQTSLGRRKNAACMAQLPCDCT
eukprot:4086827-Prymnesium_polylepis.1